MPCRSLQKEGIRFYVFSTGAVHAPIRVNSVLSSLSAANPFVSRICTHLTSSSRPVRNRILSRYLRWGHRILPPPEAGNGLLIKLPALVFASLIASDPVRKPVAAQAVATWQLHQNVKNSCRLSRMQLNNFVSNLISHFHFFFCRNDMISEFLAHDGLYCAFLGPPIGDVSVRDDPTLHPSRRGEKSFAWGTMSPLLYH